MNKRHGLLFRPCVYFPIKINNYRSLWFSRNLFKLVLFLLLRYVRRFSGGLCEVLRSALIVFIKSCGV